ncbi:MAG: outer membrane lipid asymmetry maintenance protein MlaD [Glaciecola sp.]|jgi:phospholipid/cholesterol/gamma-HCH transport system substrate-binding protein|nr:outer membrane lipid asymmetry maintenance protein MlaD [Glaciecola sp.]MDG1468551.1 outer membrane lipid asymmetry maintenance protein MlaD [Glaciecola sp.]MDG1921350.1 outer membrane lipid asymmetry maintenance protein MlaD [Glaciecola sp.]
MTTRKTELMVGLFVILTIAAGLLLALKVVNQGFSNNESTYTLYAKFDNIGGLQTRSAVKVGGVTIGRVESIDLDPEDFNPVVMISLSDKYNNFPDTSSASILTSGLLGEQYIGFQPGFAFDDFVVLADGDYIQDTKSALVLEDLIGQFLFSRNSE